MPKKKAKGKPRKIWKNNLLDDMKIMMINWMKNSRNREICHKLMEKAKTHKAHRGKKKNTHKITFGTIFSLDYIIFKIRPSDFVISTFV